MQQFDQSKLRSQRFGLGFLLVMFGGLFTWLLLWPLGVPLVLAGLICWATIGTIKTDTVTCPVCELENRVDDSMETVKCRHCEAVLKRTESGWVNVGS